uniref:O-antigen ligase n=1 Tax=viral metagenome TaxID=1070528 RepID=A0A6M3J5A0_9ZZZZ
MYGDLNIEYKFDIANPLIGQGLGHWKAVFRRKDICKQIGKWAGSDNPKGMYYQQAHNEPMQLDYETGPLSIVIIVGFLIGIFVAARHMDPRPVLALLAIIIDSLVYFPFHNPILSIGIILWLCVLLREKADTRKLRASFSYL